MRYKKIMLAAAVAGAVVCGNARAQDANAGFGRFHDSPEIVARMQANGTKQQEKICKSTKIPLLLRQFKNKNDMEKARAIYDTFAVKNGLLKTDDAHYNGRPPRVPDDAIENGGDCSEFALVVAEAAAYLGLEGGGYLVHMDGAGEDEKHTVVYVNVKTPDGEKKEIIDPQADSINKILDGGSYEILANLSFKELWYLFHREYGDYFYGKKAYKNAALSYEEALNLYKKDPYVYHSLSICYQRIGNLKKARYAAERVLELTSHGLFPKNKAKMEKYLSISYRIIVESLVEEGTERCASGDWEGGKKMLKQALEIGTRQKVIEAKEKEIIKNNLDACSG